MGTLSGGVPEDTEEVTSFRERAFAPGFAQPSFRCLALASRIIGDGGHTKSTRDLRRPTTL